MSLFSPDFFENKEYFIDEKVQFLKFHNIYRIYDPLGIQVGTVTQRVPAWHKVLRLFLKKAFFPFVLEITDNNDILLAGLKRGWTFWLSKITIYDATGEITGYIQQKFKLLRPRFRILDTEENLVAEINGDWKSWNFSITDPEGQSLGVINKKWAGLAKEIFTTADKYHVTIDPGYTGKNHKMNIVITAITIDMVLKESK